MSRYHGYSDPYTQGYPSSTPPRRQRAVTNNLDIGSLADARGSLPPWRAAQNTSSYDLFEAEREQIAEQPAPRSAGSHNVPRARCPSSFEFPSLPSLPSASINSDLFGNRRGSLTALPSSLSSPFVSPSNDFDPGWEGTSQQDSDLRDVPPLPSSRRRRASQSFQHSSLEAFDRLPDEEPQPNPFQRTSIDPFFTPAPLPRKPEFQKWRTQKRSEAVNFPVEPATPTIDTATIFARPADGNGPRRRLSTSGSGGRGISLTPMPMDMELDPAYPSTSMDLDLPPVYRTSKYGLPSLPPLPDQSPWNYETAQPTRPTPPPRPRRRSSVLMDGQNFGSLQDLPPLPPLPQLPSLDDFSTGFTSTPTRRQRQLASRQTPSSRDRSASSSTSTSRLSSPMSTDFSGEGRGRGQSFASEYRSTPATSASPSPPPSLPRLPRASAPSPPAGRATLQNRREGYANDLADWDPAAGSHGSYSSGF